MEQNKNNKKDKPEDSKKPTVTVDVPPVEAEFKFYREGGKGGNLLSNWKIIPKPAESKPDNDPPAESSIGSSSESNPKMRQKSAPKEEAKDPFVERLDQVRAAVHQHDLENGIVLGRTSPEPDLTVEITVSVRYPGKVRTLLLKPTTSVMEVKEIMSKLQKIAICNLTVLYGEQELIDDYELYRYKVKNDSQLRIKLGPCPDKGCDFCHPDATAEPDLDVD